MAGIKIEYPYDYVWVIVDKNSKWGAMVMRKPVKELTIYEIEGIDKHGYYYSTEEKAKEAVSKIEEVQ